MLKTESVSNATIAVLSHPRGQNLNTVAGLPVRAALVYVSLFTVAFCFYSVVWSSAPIMEPDSWTYLGAAQDLADFHIDQLQTRAPGYPILLVVTQSTRSPGRTLFFVSLLLHFASIWLLANVLYRAGGTEVTLILFAFILLLPPYVESAAYVLSENLAEAMIVIGFVTFIYWTLRKRVIWIITSALGFGYAALTRPNFQILAPAIAAYLIIVMVVFHWTPMKWKDVMKGTLTLLSVFIVIVGGYAFLNYKSVGCFCVTPNIGLNLTTKTARFLERLPEKYATIEDYAVIKESLIRGRDTELVTDSEHLGLGFIWGVAFDFIKRRNISEAELSGRLLKLNLLLIQKAPLHYLREVVWAFGSYWFPTSNQFANLNSRFLQLVWAVIHFCLIGTFALNLILLLGTITYLKMCNFLVGQLDNMTIGGTRLIHFQEFTYGLAGTIVIYNAVVSCLIQLGDPRHRLPTDMLIILMIFLGIHTWRRLVDLSRTALLRTQAATNNQRTSADGLS
jgi:hypothetical protein